ncbi:Hypothetical predicted protein, partial [Olea europaea subsp. europaea]
LFGVCCSVAVNLRCCLLLRAASPSAKGEDAKCDLRDCICPSLLALGVDGSGL